MLRSDDIRCLYCNAKLSLHRKLTSGQFCSAAHRKEYWKEQERLAVERLSQTGQTLRATFAELHATLDHESEPVKNLAEAESFFNGKRSRRRAQAQKPSIAQQEFARKSSNRDQVVRANFVHAPLPDGSRWNTFAAVHPPLEFLASDYTRSSIQSIASRFAPVPLCVVNAAGPVKMSGAASPADEQAVSPSIAAPKASVPKAIEPAAQPVSHDLVFRFAPEEPELLRTSPEVLRAAEEASSPLEEAVSISSEDLRTLSDTLRAESKTLVAPDDVDLTLAFVEEQPVLHEEPLVAETMVAELVPEIVAAEPEAEIPALAVSAAMSRFAPVDTAFTEAGHIEAAPVAIPAVNLAPVQLRALSHDLALAIGEAVPMTRMGSVDAAFAEAGAIEALAAATPSVDLAPVQLGTVRKHAAPQMSEAAPMLRLAACASASFGSSSAAIIPGSLQNWMTPAMLPIRELAPFGQAESLCNPPLAKMLRLPKILAIAVSSAPAESKISALAQTGSLMLGARSPRPVTPKLRYASAARYPLSTSPSEPLQETVEPADPHSFDVTLPELRLRAVPSIEAPDWGWLQPLAFEGEPVAGYIGPCVPAAALVVAFPESPEPDLPGSRLQPEPDVAFQPVPRSLRSFAHWMMAGDASGRNPWHTASDFLSHAPRDLKLALFVIPVLLAMALHPSTPKLHVAAPGASASTQRNHDFQQVLAKQWDTMQQNVAARAAVALTDDFRSGLEDWQMRGDLSAAWSFDNNGFVRPGSLALYRPSMNLTDYQLRFLGLIDKKALSFVARAEDFRNYYVIKLVVVKPGPLPTIGVTRYAVIDGKAEQRADVVAPINAMPDMLYRVDLDVHDDTYLLSLQGQIVDTWTEPRLSHGGVGFFTARGEESRIRWVQLTHQYDMLGRLCAYLAPFNIPNTNGRW